MESNNKPSILNRSFTFHSSQELPQNPPHLDRNPSSFKKMPSQESTSPGLVKRLCNSFELSRSDSTKRSFWPRLSKSKLSSTTNPIKLPGTEDRIVVFFTSLRGIRRTYEDCRAVRMIFKGFRVPVDERDISMDSAYRKEVQGVVGEKTVPLPQVFIRGNYVGGADEVKHLHETGELIKLLKGIPTKDPRIVCQSCGDARFLPCCNCSGSRKVFVEEDDLLRRCPDCNENGLIRCPECNQ